MTFLLVPEKENSLQMVESLQSVFLVSSASASRFLHAIPISEHGASPHSLRLFDSFPLHLSVPRVSLAHALLNSCLNICLSFEKVRVVFILFCI